MCFDFIKKNLEKNKVLQNKKIAAKNNNFNPKRRKFFDFLSLTLIRSLTLKKVLLIIMISNQGKCFKIYIISLSICNWNGFTSVIFFWLADYTQFTFKVKRTKSKNSGRTCLYIRKKVKFYSQNLHILCYNDVIIHQKQSKSQ